MTAPRLAWGVFGLWVALAALAAALATRTEDHFDLPFMIGLTVFAVVGAVVASRRPHNPIGWILQAIALLTAVAALVASYTATADHPAAPAMWLDDWISDLWIGLIGVAIPLLFPDGHLPSRRWRPWAWLAAAAFALGVLGRALGDRVLETEAPGTVQNPYALPGAAGDALAAVASSGVLYVVAVAIGFAGLVVRLRHSRGVERQQLKWFAYIGSLTLGALLVAALSLLVPEAVGYTVGAIAWGAFLVLVTFGLPLAIGAAILRHRLYDIDVVINRTLVYGALTATLGGTYLALVLLIGLTLGTSNLAVAISTLAVAALFCPARARIQAAVDRRFYRRRYDAARTLEAFGGRLRDELDLDALQRELVGVVGETVQPAHASLWLRSER
jgi:hypothetical protein